MLFLLNPMEQMNTTVDHLTRQLMRQDKQLRYYYIENHLTRFY